MSTKVKIAIAAVIGTALVALIVLDQKTATTPEPAKPTAPTPEPASPPGGEAVRIGPDIDEIFQNVQKGLGTKPSSPPEGNKVEKGTKQIPGGGKDKPLEEYVIQPGDNFDKIAKNKLGDAKFAHLVAEANPSVKATALRPGQKIFIPAKPEKVEKEIAKNDKADEKKSDEKKDEKKEEKKIERKDALATNTRGEQIYTVQPGDTLSGISVRIYNTSCYVDRIVEANKIEDPQTLWIGMKLVMPDLPKKEAVAVTTPGSGAVRTSANGKTYTVQPGENLWKIASKIAGDKGIEETMKAIVGLNPDKLKGIGDVVRAGWQLVMPE